jgi:hypothetical protein
MKKLTVLLFLFALILSSCEKKAEPTNMLRIKNLMTTSATNLIVGDVNFGTVAAGATTEYKAVGGGVISLSGGFTTGSSVTLPANPTVDCKYTLTINANSTLSIAEDL